MASFLFLLVLFGVIFGSVKVWTRALGRLRERRPLVHWRPWCDRPWGLLDLGVILCLMVLMQGTAAAFISNSLEYEPGTPLENLTSEQRATLIAASSTATLLAFLLSVAWLVLRYRAGPRQLGFDPARWRMDLRLGWWSFLFLAPLVYLIQLVLVQWAESKHPLMELLRENPDPLFIALSGFSALIVAPLAEELFFRLLLQGWLERLMNTETPAREILLGGYATMLPWRGGRNLIPVFVSSTLFALAHWSHGPDPIPLFVLAFGLGFLYHRTHRIVACIVVHFLLNSCSMFVLLLAIYATPPT